MGITVLSMCAHSDNSCCGAGGGVHVGNDGDDLCLYGDGYDAFAWHIRD